MKQKLEQILDKSIFSQKKEDLLVYASDSSHIIGQCRAVVWPKNVEQVQKLVKWAGKNKVSLSARGAGTGLVGGGVPQGSVVVDFSKMNKILEVDLKNKTATVESGVVLDQLNSQLQERGLFFPIIPGSHSAATIGGMIATNAAGLWALKYGRTADRVKSIQIINSWGELKKISGQDIKLVAGQEGTTGFIIQAEISLIKPPQHTYLTLDKFNSISLLLTGIEKNKNNSKTISLELICPRVAKFLDLDELYYLLAEFIGDAESEEEAKAIFAKREGIAPTLMSQGYMLIEDPWVPDMAHKQILQWFDKNQVPVFGHIGFGIFHPHFKPGQENEISEMYELVKKLGGQVSGEHGIGLKKKKFIEKNSQWQKAKQKFDVNNIFNRGKLYD